MKKNIPQLFVFKRSTTNHRGIRLDMSAMAGLAFLLLTFFLLAHDLLKPNIRQLNMPAKRRGGEEQNEFWDPGLITLIVGEPGRVYYYYGPFDHEHPPTIYTSDIGSPKLRQLLLDQNQHSMIFIKNTPTATYRDLVSILDEMQKTRQRHYVLADMLPEEHTLLGKNDL